MPKKTSGRSYSLEHPVARHFVWHGIEHAACRSATPSKSTSNVLPAFVGIARRWKELLRQGRSRGRTEKILRKGPFRRGFRASSALQNFTIVGPCDGRRTMSGLSPKGCALLVRWFVTDVRRRMSMGLAGGCEFLSQVAETEKKAKSIFASAMPSVIISGNVNPSSASFSLPHPRP